ncbi:MAG: DMT family transporter [Calditrichia bacterium]
MPYTGEIAALATAMCWSLTSIIFTAAGKRIGALQVNLYRLPLAVLLLAVTYFSFWGDLHAPVSSVVWLGISGIIGLAIGDTFLFQSMILVGARLSMVLLALVPPITALLAFLFLGESINFLGIVGIGITVAGVMWVVAERTPDPSGIRKRISLTGVFFGFMAAVGQAVGLIFAKKGLIPEMNSIFATLVRMFSALIVLWPISLLLGRVKKPRRLFGTDSAALKLMLVGVVFGPFLGVTLSLVSVKYTNTGIAATLMATVPVVMLPLVILIEKEKPTLRAVIGAAVAVAGVAIIFLR